MAANEDVTLGECTLSCSAAKLDVMARDLV